MKHVPAGGQGVRIIGIGNPDRGDDGVGPRLIAALAAQQRPELDLVTVDGESTRLLDAMAGWRRVVLVDAVRSGSPAGTLHRWLGAAAVPVDLSPNASSHALGLGAALRLAAGLDRLPPQLLVLGIEGSDFRLGAPLTGAVGAAIQPAIEALLAWVAAHDTDGAGGGADPDVSPRSGPSAWPSPCYPPHRRRAG